MKQVLKRAMKLVKLLLRLIFFISTASFAFLLFFKPPLPDREDILDKVIYQDPFQNKVDMDPFIIRKDNFRYKISPKFTYELYGLVVTEYDSENWLDHMHKRDPAQIKDVCVVWGDNIESGVYKDLEYKSGEFTCFAKPKKDYAWKLFSKTHLSNNHLIPANEAVADKIRKASVGDQIKIKGYLSEYEIYDENGDLISSRGTSTVREDQGCETIYASEFEILKGNNYLFDLYRTVSLGVSAISLLVLIIIFLAI